jgi:hypothetical protein
VEEDMMGIRKASRSIDSNRNYRKSSILIQSNLERLDLPQERIAKLSRQITQVAARSTANPPPGTADHLGPPGIDREADPPPAEGSETC